MVETITVKDKSGKPIEGLTRKISPSPKTACRRPSILRISETAGRFDAGAGVTSAGGAARENIRARRFRRSRRAARKYRDHRLLALYFDMTAMPPPDQLRALRRRRNSSHADDFGRPGGGHDVPGRRGAGAGGFYRRSRTAAAHHRNADRRRSQGIDETASDDSSADTGAAFGQDDSEFNIFNTDRQLSALQTAVKMLGQLNEKKALIYFASGLRLNGMDNQAQLARDHQRGDSRGRFVLAGGRARPGGAGAAWAMRRTGSPGGLGMYSGNSAMQMTTNFQKSQDTSVSLAADTGGKALLDNNDLSRGIRERAEGDVELLRDRILHHERGARRQIPAHQNLAEQRRCRRTLDYRQGYYADKEFAKFTAADKERQLEDALMLDDPITEMTIAMEVNYFQLNRAEYFVPLIVKIPGSELALARKGGAERTLIDFIGEVKDDFGNTIRMCATRWISS